MHLSISDAAALVTVIGAVVAVGGWGLRKVLKRMVSNGKVATTEASVLWAQSQDMRKVMLEQLTNAERQLGEVTHQRDRLIENYSNQLIPALAVITKLLEQIQEAGSDRPVITRPPGGEHELAPPPAPEALPSD